jgi:hypothetical protein
MLVSNLLRAHQENASYIIAENTIKYIGFLNIPIALYTYSYWSCNLTQIYYDIAGICALAFSSYYFHNCAENYFYEKSALKNNSDVPFLIDNTVIRLRCILCIATLGIAYNYLVHISMLYHWIFFGITVFYMDQAIIAHGMNFFENKNSVERKIISLAIYIPISIDCMIVAYVNGYFYNMILLMSMIGVIRLTNLFREFTHIAMHVFFLVQTAISCAGNAQLLCG